MPVTTSTKQRIKRPAEFRRVFAQGKRAGGACANLVVLQNDLTHSRLGLSVSKRVGSAVTRNLVKRRLRHAVADMNIASGWDVVITARPQASSVSYARLDESIKKSFKRLGIQLDPTDKSGAPA